MNNGEKYQHNKLERSLKTQFKPNLNTGLFDALGFSLKQRLSIEQKTKLTQTNESTKPPFDDENPAFSISVIVTMMIDANEKLEGINEEPKIRFNKADRKLGDFSQKTLRSEAFYFNNFALQFRKLTFIDVFK